MDNKRKIDIFIRTINKRIEEFLKEIDKTHFSQISLNKIKKLEGCEEELDLKKLLDNIVNNEALNLRNHNIVEIINGFTFLKITDESTLLEIENDIKYTVNSRLPLLIINNSSYYISEKEVFKTDENLIFNREEENKISLEEIKELYSCFIKNLSSFFDKKLQFLFNELNYNKAYYHYLSFINLNKKNLPTKSEVLALIIDNLKNINNKWRRYINVLYMKSKTLISININKEYTKEIIENLKHIIKLKNNEYYIDNTKNDEIFTLLGNAYNTNGEYEKAIESYNNAIENQG